MTKCCGQNRAPKGQHPCSHVSAGWDADRMGEQVTWGMSETSRLVTGPVGLMRRLSLGCGLDINTPGKLFFKKGLDDVYF